MALSEEEIVRYSRQILLREVGGTGQQKLLESVLAVGGRGAAAGTAVAYLAASGMRVSHELYPLTTPGFPLPPAVTVPGPASASPVTWLSEEVALSGTEAGGGALIVCAPGGTCDGCVREALSGACVIPDRVADLAGALGALMVQRRVLGLAERAPHQVRIGADGGLTVEPLSRCTACR